MNALHIDKRKYCLMGSVLFGVCAIIFLMILFLFPSHDLIKGLKQTGFLFFCAPFAGCIIGYLITGVLISLNDKAEPNKMRWAFFWGVCFGFLCIWLMLFFMNTMVIIRDSNYWIVKNGALWWSILNMCLAPIFLATWELFIGIMLWPGILLVCASVLLVNGIISMCWFKKLSQWLPRKDNV